MGPEPTRTAFRKLLDGCSCRHYYLAWTGEGVAGLRIGRCVVTMFDAAAGLLLACTPTTADMPIARRRARAWHEDDEPPAPLAICGRAMPYRPGREQLTGPGRAWR